VERVTSEVEQLRQVVRSVLERDARVLVISKGDETLLGFEGGVARHFPCNDDGSYTGYHPADSADAITRLNEQITLGFDYLVIPVSSSWWLEFYDEFRSYLDSTHHLVLNQKHVGAIFQLKLMRNPK
jgi:hypothetical protein